MENKTLRIALLCDTFYPMVDGVINAMDNYAKNLCLKHDVTVFVPQTDKNFVDNFPYKVVRCKTLPIKFGDYSTPIPQFDRKFKKALKEGNFDIFHLHSPFFVGRTGLKIAKKLHTPTVITLHSQFKQDFMDKTHSKLITHFLMKFIAKTFNGCNELWTMSPKLESLSHEYGYKGQVTILPNGSDIQANEETLKNISAFRKQYAKRGEKLLLFVGRIHRLKNIEFILQVCSKLQQQNYPFKMLFVGSGQDLAHFQKRSKDLHLTDRVIFVGKVTDRAVLAKFYACSDLFIFPSKYDTDGIVKNEAAAFNTPSILLKDCFAASNITDNENGYLEEENANKFAQRITQIFQDKSTYNKVCKNAQQTLFFTWPQIVEKAEKEYLRIIQQAKK